VVEIGEGNEIGGAGIVDEDVEAAQFLRADGDDPRRVVFAGDVP
jgi:hypothetical protein